MTGTGRGTSLVDRIKAWRLRRRAPTTGATLFLILSAALLPLALIAIGATIQTSRLADEEVRARLRVAGAESARALGIELVGDMTALRATLNALGADTADAPSCARAEGVFAQQSASGARFAISDAQGRLLCGQPGIPTVDAEGGSVVAAKIDGQRGLVLAVDGRPQQHGGAVTARAYFPAAFLVRIGEPSIHGITLGTELIHRDHALMLNRIADLGPFDRTQSYRADIGIADLSLSATTRSAPITSSLVVAMLLPLLMWLAAAGIAWLVVDRLLIRPLKTLSLSVASYTPGGIIDTGDVRTLPAQEIRELGETFRAISRTVALHEAGLAAGLVRQTKLTREVHHRVKNNLQVISSLINLHARGAISPDAINAYSSIQRRVEALAVVHRNHYAEMEENRGLNLRATIGELAASIRAGAAERSPGIGIVLDLDPYLANQDGAVAVAFLVTELIELSLAAMPAPQIRVSLKPGIAEDKAKLRVSSTALIDTDRVRELLGQRFGRVIDGLARQLRSPLHYDPLIGAYEIQIAVLGRD